MNTFTSGHNPDPKYTFKLMINGELEGEYHSMSQVNFQNDQTILEERRTGKY